MREYKSVKKKKQGKIKKGEEMKSILSIVKKALTVAAFSGLSLLCASSSFADGGMELNGLKISGYLEVSGLWNLNKPSTRLNSWRAFDVDSNTFDVPATQIVFEKQNEGGALFKAKLLLGKSGAIMSTYENTNLGRLQEAYLQIPMGEKLSLTAGKWVTLEGVEVIESHANYNTSHGLLFTWAEALTHTGLRLDYKASDAALLKFAIVNGWDVVKDNNDAKTLMAQLNWTMSPKASFTITDMLGAEQTGKNGPKRNSLDVVGNFNLMEDLTAAAQINLGDEEGLAAGGKRAKWDGWGIWLKKKMNESLSLAARYETFNDKDGARTAVKQKLQNITVTAELPMPKVNDVTMRLEYRADSSDVATFDNNGNASKSQNTVSANWVYKF